MKLITLNTWGGRAGEKLTEFFERHSDIDVFLLQEVCHNAKTVQLQFPDIDVNSYTKIQQALPEHTGHYFPAQFGEWGLAALIRKNLQPAAIDEAYVYRHRDAQEGNDPVTLGKTLGKNLQYASFVENDRALSLVNIHGLWTGEGKSDTPDRLLQSRNIIEATKKLPGEIVMAGDFNLLPNTESLKIIEKELGLRNLITEYGITSTRTSYYTKPLKFADYVLVSPGIKVNDFKVLPDEVSDHTALYLDFSS